MSTHHHTIDPETGYQDSIECECRPCTDCDGEGSGTSYCDPGCGRGGYGMTGGCPGHDWTCSACKGTGKISEDCAVHGEALGPVYVEGGALALGAEWEHDDEPTVRKIAATVQIPASLDEVAA